MITSSQQAAIKENLLHWRDEVIANNSFETAGLDEGAKQSRVIHDVFIDAIAANASSIKCPQDLYTVAYYWKWIDLYGAEVYARVAEHLQAPKRLREDDMPRTKRVCC